jgi:integrase
MVWMGIGLGSGQPDLASVRVGQIDREGYDLRRGKRAMERFGKTPPLVWAYVTAYLTEYPRADGDLMFITRKGLPIVHSHADSVQQWWHKARKAIGESSESLEGFYVLRHVGATELGSRPGCSISDMRRWLGHATSSRVADVYMKPVAPEHKPLVSWVRRQPSSTRVGA